MKLRISRRAGRAVLALLVLATGFLAIAELVTPPVVDAPARVTAIDKAGGSSPVMISPTDKIAIATVAAEDEHFYTHHGIDTLGVVRALWGKIIGVDLGGSTIDQQLAKVLYMEGSTSWPSRMGQVAISLKFEGHYSKTAILSMYLDAVYYGHHFYGIAAASKGYFGVPVDQLSWAQASLLAGLPQAPSLLNPFNNLSGAKLRQRYVLDRLVVNGLLTTTQANAAASAPLDLVAPG